MNESYKFSEVINGKQLASAIQNARKKSLESLEKNDLWCQTVFQWDAEFKIRLKERYGDTRFAQQVPAWQILVGGTVEEEVDITTEQRDYILKEVSVIFKELQQLISD